jgi:hypothetical protein
LLGLLGRMAPGQGCLSLVSVVCCQVQVPATGRSHVRKSPTECPMSEYDLETSTMKKPLPIRAVEPSKKTGQFRTVSKFVQCRILASYDYQVGWHFIYKVCICIQ